MNITGASAPITLQGKEYQITPLSDQARGALTQWVRSDLMAVTMKAKQSLYKDPDVTTDALEGMAKSIIQAVQQVEWLDDNGSAVIRTRLGMARLLLESLKPTVAAITEAKCVALLKDADESELFWETFLMVNDMQEVEVGEGESGSIEKKKRTEAGDVRKNPEPSPELNALDAGEANADPTGSTGC